MMTERRWLPLWQWLSLAPPPAYRRRYPTEAMLMKQIHLLALLAFVGCSQPTRSTYDLDVVSIPSDDPNHREVQLQFETPAEAEVQVTSDGDTSTVTVDRLNSAGTFKVTLSVTRNAASNGDRQTFTTLVRPESPTGAYAGGPSSYTVDGKKTLDDVLDITAVPTVVPYGVPHTVGSLNGKPITILVKPTAMTP
jgi:hypothetical protein